MTKTSPPTDAPQPAPACRLDSCDASVPLNERGRPRKFCTPEHARQYHNQARYTNRPTPVPTTTNESPDAWTLLTQLGDQLPRLVRELRTERAQLDPDSVRAQLAEADATARRAVERANTAEQRTAHAEDDAAALLEGAEAETTVARENLDQTRAQLAEAHERLDAATTERDDARRAQTAAIVRAERAEAERDEQHRRAEQRADAAAERERATVRERDQAVIDAARAGAERDAALTRAQLAEAAAETARAQLAEALQRAARAEAERDSARATDLTALVDQLRAGLAETR